MYVPCEIACLCTCTCDVRVCASTCCTSSVRVRPLMALRKLRRNRFLRRVVSCHFHACVRTRIHMHMSIHAGICMSYSSLCIHVCYPCMCVCVCVCVRVSMYVSECYAHMPVCVSMYVCLYMLVYVFTMLFVCTCLWRLIQISQNFVTFTYIRMHILKYTRMHTYLCALPQMSACTHTYIHIYTPIIIHIHTYIPYNRFGIYSHIHKLT